MALMSASFHVTLRSSLYPFGNFTGTVAGSRWTWRSGRRSAQPAAHYPRSAMRYRNEPRCVQPYRSAHRRRCLDIEYGIGGQLSVGHLTPRDGEVTARTVGVYGAHGGWQLQIISLEPVCTSRLTSSTLTGSMAYARTRKTHDGALREDHAQLVGFRRCRRTSLRCLRSG